jgi:hypothetical protein
MLIKLTTSPGEQLVGPPGGVLAAAVLASLLLHAVVEEQRGGGGLVLVLLGLLAQLLVRVGSGHQHQLALALERRLVSHVSMPFFVHC